MEFDDLLSFLKNAPLFQELTTPDIIELVKLLQVRTFAAHEVIFAEGDAADALYLVHEGKLEGVCTGEDERTHPVFRFGYPDLFGEIELLQMPGDPMLRCMTVRALDECVLVRLPASRFQQLLESGHPAGPKLVQGMARDLSRRHARLVRAIAQRDSTQRSKKENR